MNPIKNLKLNLQNLLGQTPDTNDKPPLPHHRIEIRWNQQRLKKGITGNKAKQLIHIMGRQQTTHEYTPEKQRTLKNKFDAPVFDHTNGQTQPDLADYAQINPAQLTDHR